MSLRFQYPAKSLMKIVLHRLSRETEFAYARLVLKFALENVSDQANLSEMKITVAPVDLFVNQVLFAGLGNVFVLRTLPFVMENATPPMII